MGNAILASAAYGWFAGMLVIMIVVCILFGVIMYIALRPIHKDVPAETTSDKLRRREAEIASQLVNKQNNSQETAQLMQQLREVNSAQNIVKEMEPVEEKPEVAKPVKKSGTAKPAAKKPSAPKPAPKTVSNEKAKPEQAAKPVPAGNAKPEQVKAAPKTAAPKAEPVKETKPQPEVKAK